MSLTSSRYSASPPPGVEPGQHAVRIPAERRRAAEQRSRLVLAIPDVADAVTAIENAGVHGILHLERRHHRARREHIELQPPAGHLFDLLGVVDGELVKDIARRPRRLEPPDRGLRARHLRHRHRREARGQQQRRRGSVAPAVIRLAMPIYIASPRAGKAVVAAPAAGALAPDRLRSERRRIAPLSRRRDSSAATASCPARYT